VPGAASGVALIVGMDRIVGGKKSAGEAQEEEAERERRRLERREDVVIEES